MISDARPMIWGRFFMGRMAVIAGGDPGLWLTLAGNLSSVLA